MHLRLAFVPALAVLVAVPVLAAAQQPAAEPALHTFASVAISPDGRTVASLESVEAPPDAVETPAATIVLRPVAGGPARRIGCPGADKCRLGEPVWSPDGSRLAYVVRDVKAGTVSVRTAGADGSNDVVWLASFAGLINAPSWSPDGSSLAVLATAGAHKEIGATQAGAPLTGEIAATLAQDVQRIAIVGRDGTLRFASPADLFVYEYDWTPDGTGFAATGAHGNGDNSWWVARLYAIDAKNASALEIHRSGSQMNAPRVSPDGKSVAFIEGLMSDFGSVGGDVVVAPLAGGPEHVLTPGMPESATSLSWNHRSDRVTFTALAGEKSTVETVDVATRRMDTVWSAPRTISGDRTMRVSFARDGTTSAVVRQDFEHPEEIAVGPVGRWHDLTHENDGAAPAARATSVAWTNEGFHVQGWLLAPRNADTSTKHAMIVQIHGGPSAAVTPRFLGRGTTRDLIARGYYVFEPNPRGSYGQGEAFTAANRRDFGGGDLRDVLAGIDAVEKIAPVDDARLGITGGSYGGFMTMWTVTQSQRFKAAVAGAGIANWLSYYGENGIDEWMIPFFGASAYDDPAVYAKSSPITFIKNARTPTFVFVGERDVECPAPQSQEFWHALAAQGVPTSLVIYAGEGHGIRGLEHVRDLTRRTLAWFDTYLKP